MPEIIRKHQNLYRFSCQGLYRLTHKCNKIKNLGTEKKNDNAKKSFSGAAINGMLQGTYGMPFVTKLGCYFAPILVPIQPYLVPK